MQCVCTGPMHFPCVLVSCRKMCCCNRLSARSVEICGFRAPAVAASPSLLDDSCCWPCTAAQDSPGRPFHSPKSNFKGWSTSPYPTAGGLKLIRCNFAVAVDVNHLKVDDIGH